MQFWDDITIKKIREGFYSAIYFTRTKYLLLSERNTKSVTMQIFQKKDRSLFCGVSEVVELLESATGYFENNQWVNTSSEITVNAIPEGKEIGAYEPVMHITGPYAYFSHLESLYLGILARRTRVATKVHETVIKAQGKPVYFFADRFDYFLNQEGDGYAAKIGGISGVSTPAHAFLWNGKPMGTIPHALIAMYGSDAVVAAELFLKNYPKVPLIVLADFTNDCVSTSVTLVRTLGKRLYGVRLDTSEGLIDNSLRNEPPQNSHGVTPLLVTKVRNALNTAGGQHVKIIVSGGFTPEKLPYLNNSIPLLMRMVLGLPYSREKMILLLTL